MEHGFEELDYQQTDRGELILRRRKVPMLQDEVVYEVILNGEFLMSSLFHAAEDALAHLALGRLAERRDLRVLVGGLGLGHTAASALDLPEVASLDVIDIFPELIDWHRRHLVPLGARLCEDARCRIIEADFFAGIAGNGFAPDAVEPVRYDALLLDIDHTPTIGCTRSTPLSTRQRVSPNSTATSPPTASSPSGPTGSRMENSSSGSSKPSLTPRPRPSPLTTR